jgi:acetyl esterase/lipase
LVFIHSGGWRHHGNRQATSWETELAAERGYVAVTVDYRLLSGSEGIKTNDPFPAQLHDVKCAVRWLRGNAEQYNIDPARIGVYGCSFGGYLALMLGLTDLSDAMEGECGNLNLSSEVQAVVNMSGLTDLPSLLEIRPA